MATASHQPNYTVLMFGKHGKNIKITYLLKRGEALKRAAFPSFFYLSSSCIFRLITHFNVVLAQFVNSATKVYFSVKSYLFFLHLGYEF